LSGSLSSGAAPCKYQSPFGETHSDGFAGARLCVADAVAKGFETELLARPDPTAAVASSFTSTRAPTPFSPAADPLAEVLNDLESWLTQAKRGVRSQTLAVVPRPSIPKPDLSR
jgi:hypothetical protein